MKKEEPKPVKVYEEKKAYNFKPKMGKKGLENYVPFLFVILKKNVMIFEFMGKSLKLENRTLRTGKDIQTYGLRMMMTLSS